jgi:hypothetical protein
MFEVAAVIGPQGGQAITKGNNSPMDLVPKHPLAEMQGNAMYIRTKVVEPFSGLGASRRYVYAINLDLI